MGLGWSSLVEHMLGLHEILGPIPSATVKREKKKDNNGILL